MGNNIEYKKISGKSVDWAIIGPLAIIFAAILWGVDGAILTPMLHDLDVFVAVFLLHAVAFALMIPLLMLELRNLTRISAKDWQGFFWIALFGGALGTIAIVKALFMVNFIPLSVPILLQKLQPVFAIILALIVLKERPSPYFYPLAALALVGSYLITFGFAKPVIGTGNLTLMAALLGMLAAFSWGSSTVFGRKVLGNVNFRLSTYIRFGLTSLIMLIFIATLGKFAAFEAVTSHHMLIFLIIALTTGGTAIAIYYFGLRHVQASKATIYELAMPITVIALDYMLRGSVMSPGQWLGAGLLIASIIAINRLKKSDL